MVNTVNDKKVWYYILKIRFSIWKIAASRCTQIQCQNGGTCYEHSPATSVFAYCACPPGFTGQFCESSYY